MITFTASDGVLKASQLVKIKVNSLEDTDEDGMPDAWEIEYFGTLDRDGTGDFDGDGISDLDEFLNGTDPTQGNGGPSVPVIQSPETDSEITTLQPELVIQNSTNSGEDTLTYTFEIYSDAGLTTLIAGESDVPEGVSTTSWSPPSDLSDNAWYFWRVRANDGTLYSLWAYGSFFVNTENDPPGSFNISSPGDTLEVDSVTPTLEITNSFDIDKDVLNYTFQVYSDSAQENLVVFGYDIPEGENGTTSWTVDLPLSDSTWYCWKVIAVDEHDATSETILASFRVNTGNASPEAPVTLYPDHKSEIDLQELDLIVGNAVDPEGNTLTYFFELDKVNTFDSPAKQTSGEVAEGVDTTTWHVTGPEDNTYYCWRIKAYDGAAQSPWKQGSFFINTANDPPATNTSRNPGLGSWVDTPTPVLEINPMTDPDNDALSYRFEIYADEALTDLVFQAEMGSLRCTISSPLDNASWYYWRIQSVDEHGASSEWSSGISFFIKDNGVDDPPQITITDPSEDLFFNGQDIIITWEDTDPDSNADISLYYDTDSGGQDGTLITDAIKEDADDSDDSFLWNITGIQDGTYYIYATITDGTNTNTEYSAGSVTIDRTPPVVSATPAGGTYATSQDIILSSNEQSDIYYTLDGTDPTASSTIYTAPIEVTEDITLKAMAVDLAGNQSETITETYYIQQKIAVRVETGTGRRLQGLKVYAFTEAGSYTGKSSTTDTQGDALFSPENFANGTYKFRVDYLGCQFWSEVITIPDTLSTTVLINEETVQVTVTKSSGPAQGIRVYLFSESGSYLGVYGTTDANGMVSFVLPVGKNFKFRTDILGSQYWSDVTTITGGGTNNISVDTGGGIFGVKVQKDPSSPMEGIKVYLFTATGSYLGLSDTTDSSGMSSFDVSEGTYKVRADYLGYQFWTNETFVTIDTTIDLTIAHEEVEITIQGLFQETPESMQGITVYLFSSNGSYLGKQQSTNENGKAWFDLPNMPYKVRADYLAQQFWSEEFTWEDITVNIPMADAEITVTGAGLPREGVPVYVFSLSGSYLGLYQTTDIQGKVTFHLPENAYLFRADYQGSQHWTPETILTADMVNPINLSVGGGSFTLNVSMDGSSPLVGVKCYVFNEAGSYLGLFGATNNDGDAFFDLANGTYKFRVDYLGCQFWSEIITIPDTLSTTVLIDEETVQVTVTKSSGPAQGIRVYLFSESGSYLGVYAVTDANGMVSFVLPVGRNFKFRTDILGNQYWSDVTTVTGGGTNNISVDAGGGIFSVKVQKDLENPMEGIRVYLFSAAGSYLGLYDTTDSSGMALFDVSEGTYKVRADYLGYQFWSNETFVTIDTTIDLTIAHEEVEITIQGLFQETLEPMQGITVYLFSSNGSYLGKYQSTNENRKAYFDLPNVPYKVRADYLAQQFWSEEFTWEDTIVTINKGLAEIHASQSGMDVAGARVYLFSEGGSYLGWYEITGADGKAGFLIPDKPYKFRVDYSGEQYWSSVIDIVEGVVNSIEVYLD